MIAGKILIVDDLPDWRKTMSGLLTDRGYSVKDVGSAESAIQLLENEYFNIAILDVRLDESDEGNRDGLALMRQIKKRWPTIEVIILTGYAELSMAQEALNADTNGYRFAYSFLEKSQTDELIKHIRQAYEKSVDFLISQGEQETIEFKSSIRWDYKRGGVNKELQLPIAKSIAGMLNYRGGTLLVGVADDGKVLGIDKDFMGLRKPDTDGFHLALTEIIRNYLSLDSMEYIHVRFATIDGKQICVIAIGSNKKPVFITNNNTSEFWVRVGNSTRQLNVKEATEYIQSHWGKND